MVAWRGRRSLSRMIRAGEAGRGAVPMKSYSFLNPPFPSIASFNSLASSLVSMSAVAKSNNALCLQPVALQSPSSL